MKLSDKTLLFLQKLTQQEALNKGVEQLIAEYIGAQLKYWQLKNQEFERVNGMDYATYEATKREEWDGADFTKIEAFWDWQAAVTGINYYKKLQEEWTLVPLKQS